MSGMKQKALSNPPSQPRVEGGLDSARALTTNTVAVCGAFRQAHYGRGGNEAQLKRVSVKKNPHGFQSHSSNASSQTRLVSTADRTLR